MQRKRGHKTARTAVAALVAAAIVAVPAGAAPVRAGQQSGPMPTTLAGFTSQHWPVFFRFSKDRRALVIASVAIDLKCTSGNEFTFEDEFAGLRVSTGGRLNGGWAQPPTKLSDGYTVGGTGSLTATLDRKHSKLTGVWEVQQTFISPTGQSDQCSSGPVKVDATA